MENMCLGSMRPVFYEGHRLGPVAADARTGTGDFLLVEDQVVGAQRHRVGLVGYSEADTVPPSRTMRKACS